MIKANPLENNRRRSNPRARLSAFAARHNTQLRKLGTGRSRPSNGNGQTDGPGGVIALRSGESPSSLPLGTGPAGRQTKSSVRREVKPKAEGYSRTFWSIPSSPGPNLEKEGGQ
ncbi:hypothetical protein SKAU_G00298320 [Synaphobranchus kaupii]|uniref:Uncharacterized protein n=1 Tax=Synaphobranchus kaupii TaxID=118154 RepID=A0A9Q1EV52_SYNKA|nr:hypothetical protein SKAU_G00298320 [Synaphobranchus kaupii]